MANAMTPRERVLAAVNHVSPDRVPRDFWADVPAMAPESLAEHFGGRICFHGGIDMQQLLPRGTVPQVRAEVERYK